MNQGAVLSAGNPYPCIVMYGAFDTMDGRELTLFNGRQSPAFSPRSSPEKYSIRESGQLDYISQFASDMQNTSRVNNVATDALFRISSLNRFQGIDSLKPAQF